MGTQCSCIPEQNVRNLTDIIPSPAPTSAQTNLESTDHILFETCPLQKFPDAYGIKIQRGSQDLPSLNKKPFAKMWSRLQTDDGDPVQKDDSNDSLKKTSSFFRFSTLESRYQANPIEHVSNFHGDAWKLQNIKLESIIQKSPGKYLWEARNIAIGKKCAVKISLIESSKLRHNNFMKTELVLRDLSEIHSPNVIDIFSFCVFECEFHDKPFLAIVIIQELVRCSLRDIHSFKTEKGAMWTPNNVLVIIRDVYAGLVACKEKQHVHGRLHLENVMVSKNMERALIADLALKLPLFGDNELDAPSPLKSSPPRSIHSNGRVPSHSKVLNTPDERDIYNLTVLTLKLLTKDESVGFSFESLRKDEKFKRIYNRVFKALDLIADVKKPPAEVLNELSELIDKNCEKLNIDIDLGFDNMYQPESYVDLLFSKIECYELLNQQITALDIYLEVITIFEKKDKKSVKESQEYVKCVNRTIKYYLSRNDWLKAKDISTELNRLLKKDETLKKTLKAYPKEYISFMFLLGNISEGLNEHEKALTLYTKGISYCMEHNIELEAHSSILKRMSNIYMQRKEYQQALGCLRKLLDYYETQEGYFVDKADGYLNMGDIVTKQGDLGQGVKLYLKGLENLKKGRMNNKEAFLSLTDKIVENYRELHEDEKALNCMLESLELRKEIFGKDSFEYMEEVKEIATVQARIGNYEGALNHYLLYQRAAMRDKAMEEQYAESLIFIGNIYIELRQYEKARQTFEKYAEIQKKTQGNENTEYLAAQDKLASIFYKEERFKDCLEIQLTTFTLKEKLFTRDDLYIVLSLSNIGDTYFADGQYTKALQFHEKALNRLEIQQEQHKKEYSQLLLKVALDYDKAGNSGEALNSVYQSFKITNKEECDSDMRNTIEMYELLSKARELQRKSLDFIHLAKTLEY